MSGSWVRTTAARLATDPVFRRRAFLGGLIPPALAASSITLFHLAADVGWSSWVAWVLPLALDALAVFALIEHMDLRNSAEARKLALWVCGGALAGSVAGNALGHLVSVDMIRVTWPLVVGAGAVPPLCLAAAIHLGATCSRTAKKQAAPKPKTTPAPKTERPAAETKAPERPRAVPDAPAKATDEEIMTAIRKGMGKNEALAHFGIGPSRYYRLKDKVAA